MTIKPSGFVILISSMIFKFRIQTPELVITWSRFAGMKFHPPQPGQISAYDYMGKSNFIPAIRDSFPPGTCLDLFIFFKFFFGEISPQQYKKGTPSSRNETFYM